MQFTFWDEHSPEETDEDDVQGLLANRIGKAGEYIVAAELELAGLSCSIASEGLPFDLIAADTDGNIHRVQVKTRSKAKGSKGYQFKGYKPRGPGRGRKRGLCDYNDVDVLALVAIDKRAALYVRSSEVSTKSINILEKRYLNENLRALSLQTAFSSEDEG